jgi:hypothetical protein
MVLGPALARKSVRIAAASASKEASSQSDRQVQSSGWTPSNLNFQNQSIRVVRSGRSLAERQLSEVLESDPGNGDISGRDPSVDLDEAVSVSLSSSLYF